MKLSDLINDYLENYKSDDKQAVIQLLTTDIQNLKNVKSRIEDEKIDVDLILNMNIETLKENERFRLMLADLLLELLSTTTNTKDATQKRLLHFSKYLEARDIPLVLDTVFRREALNPYERLVDLLKVLQEGKTREELREHYSISNNPLRKDMDALIYGTKILGQKVKIRNIQEENRKITYQSTVHPIFLPLNLTEVYQMTVGLKLLERSQNTIMGETLSYIADNIFCQLSEYAREVIRRKGIDQGICFPEENNFHLFNGSRDEETVATQSIDNALSYAWKSGALCTIILKNKDSEPIQNVHVDYDIKTKEAFIYKPNQRDNRRKLNINEVVDIKLEYI